ncbi:signal peptidase [Haloarcula quadrata]|uniref:Signal peptidase n=1 Tax=Haloarcula quadrata TaxID=182779 RepID=A0A495R6L8_9EURY|nr:signal peptidase I [Haloarcula quadrata]RKS82746.1 signal peptidase [Haloarcula quadrata]
MGLRRGGELVLEAALIVFLVSMILGQVLGQPVLLGFVTSGSMAPTIETGDGFVAIPAALAGPVEEGDVVTFRAEEIQGGGLTTHRIVEETDRGYITKGDANPFTDQDGDEPPVKETQIVAIVWQPGGTVVTVPGVGAVVTGTQSTLQEIQRQIAALVGARSLLGTQGLAYFVVALSVVAYVADILLSDDRKREREPERSTGTNVRLIVAVFAGAIVLSATAAMVGPAGPQEFGVVSAESDSPGPRVIEQGTSESVQYITPNDGFVPVVRYVEPVTEGVEIEPREAVVPARSSVNGTLTLTAPPETGYYRYYVVEHRYLLVLPQSTIETLHAVHPWLPIVVIDGLLSGSFYLLWVVMVDNGRIRRRTRDGPSRLDRILSRI